MKKYIRVKLPNSNCTGISLEIDSDINIKEVTTVKEANKYINGVYKLHLRIKKNGIDSSKVFYFNTNDIGFKKSIDQVSSTREELKKKLATKGTLREKYIENSMESNTFLEQAKLFIKQKSISLRQSSIDNYSTNLLTHSKELHNKLYNSITIHDVQKQLNKLIGKRKPATVKLLALNLKTFLKPLNLDWSTLEIPSVHNKVDYTLPIEDTRTIIKAMRSYSLIKVSDKEYYQFPEVRNIFLFLLTGRRVSEVLNLKYSDLNLSQKIFRIPASKAKGKKELVFDLDDTLLNALETQSKINHIELNDKLDLRIFNYTKETPRWHFQKLLKTLNLPKLRLHDIRHMLATTLLQNEVAVADVSRMLGHSSIIVTEQRYVTKSKEQASRALKALDSII
ncbi:tyrosine-type recombinase/integrase [Halarcobacter ebronensis]|uniref:Integrase n=1 Tax=Halarcobacter ebronensis TaxID=1462615 RepID=A0A4Q1AZG2_9BACT|nr:integrase [Halarcobacter ebronensis]QKF82399.1 site-specific tyrosine recombinase, phage integrase family (INT_Rci_Hp1_C domain) [Halarcobacter ebronensis]RXK07578.1 hypothetical protein CRV07_03705 [Halarcobacter ebronensis]